MQTMIVPRSQKADADAASVVVVVVIIALQQLKLGRTRTTSRPTSAKFFFALDAAARDDRDAVGCVKFSVVCFAVVAAFFAGAFFAGAFFVEALYATLSANNHEMIE